jgi:threonine/homoserine/homoserine lactone efflux protein
MEYGYTGTFVLAFLIGLTGALAPGPTLVATISASLKSGWTTGPRVTFGHMLIEALVFILILLGLSAAAFRYSAPIAVLGGCALIAFGLLTIRESRGATLPGASADRTLHPYFAGVVTSATNPYFWIWWLTIGSVFLLSTLSGGILLALVFMAGHWTADLGWYTFVSSAVHRGRLILSGRAYRLTLAACGIFLVCFGGYYLAIAGNLGSGGW